MGPWCMHCLTVLVPLSSLLTNVSQISLNILLCCMHIVISFMQQWKLSHCLSEQCAQALKVSKEHVLYVLTPQCLSFQWPDPPPGRPSTQHIAAFVNIAKNRQKDFPVKRTGDRRGRQAPFFIAYIWTIYNFAVWTIFSELKDRSWLLSFPEAQPGKEEVSSYRVFRCPMISRKYCILYLFQVSCERVRCLLQYKSPAFMRSLNCQSNGVYK